MKLINQQWSNVQKAWVNEWQADVVSDVTADFDPEGAVGSTVMVISTGSVYIKNSTGKWQKFGSTEVIA